MKKMKKEIKLKVKKATVNNMIGGTNQMDTMYKDTCFSLNGRYSECCSPLPSYHPQICSEPYACIPPVTQLC